MTKLRRFEQLHSITMYVFIVASLAFSFAVFADVLLELRWGYTWVDAFAGIAFAAVGFLILVSGRAYFALFRRLGKRDCDRNNGSN